MDLGHRSPEDSGDGGDPRAASQGEEARLTILGSGTLLPDADRAGAAHHLRAPHLSMLLDCGPGTVSGVARYHIDWQSLTHVCLTHFHNDHIGDLGALLFALKHGLSRPREAPLTVVGPADLEGVLQRLSAALGPHVLDPGFEVMAVPLASNASVEAGGGSVLVRAAGTHHTEGSLAYRVEGRWGAVGYTGDTGPTEGLGTFFRGVDVLIAECTLTDPPTLPTHLSPAGVAELAVEARPGTLVLTHVAPPLTPERAVEAVRAAGYEGSTVAGTDGMVFDLGGTPPSKAEGRGGVVGP